MLAVKAKLKEFPGKGIGLIADEDIEKGQIIWTYNPAIDIKVKKQDIKENTKEFFDTYAVDQGGDFVLISIDNSRFANHSKTPNTKGLGPMEDNIAIRDIKKGEELTVDYTEIDINPVDFMIL